MSRTRGAVIAGLLALLVLPAVARQNPSQPVPRFQTGVELVLLDVSVLDRDRLPVHGLMASDFTILDDGRPQAIQTFSEVALPDVTTSVETPSAAPWVTQVAPDVRRNADFKDRRVVVIVMDDATPMPAVEVPRAKAVATKAIEHLSPKDIAAVVFPLNAGAGQEFTQDRARLLAAVSRFNGALDYLEGLDKKTGEPRKIFFDELDGGAGTLYHAVLGTLRGVIDSLAALPERRKAVFFVSVGIPLDEAMAAPALVTPVGDANGVAHQVIYDAGECFEAAQRANVNIYGLDPGGLRAPYDLAVRSSEPASPGRLNREFLQAVAENTGGFTVTNTNDPVPGIIQAFRENASYYLLGYAPPKGRVEGRFHRIQVRVNRSDVTIRARTGYWEARTADRQKNDRAARPVDVALAGVLPRTDLDMQVTAAPFGMSGTAQARVAIVLGVRQPSPPAMAAAVQEIDLQVAAYSPDGNRRAGRREKIEAKINRAGTAAEVGYETFTLLDLPSGRYQLRLAAESSLRSLATADRAQVTETVSKEPAIANRSGSVYYDLDVPDFLRAHLSLSGLVLSVSPPVLSGPKDRFAGLIPLVPTTLRAFTAEDAVTAFLRIYQGGNRALAVVKLTARVADDTDNVVFAADETLGADRFAKGRAADYSLNLPVARLNRGRYLLKIQATSGNEVIRRDVRFEMR